MADKPKDVRINIVHEGLERRKRGALTQISTTIKDAGFQHLLRFCVVLEWRALRTAEDGRKTSAVAQLSRAVRRTWARWPRGR